MIQKFDLIAGSVEDIREYIESLDTFDSWQLGKNYYDQIDNMLDRPGLQNHIGAVTYQERDSDKGVTIHAAFIAIAKQPMKFA
jgi:virulence-associated protein VapD